MPQGSEIVDDIPNSFLGEYLEIHFKEHSIIGSFKTISRVSEKRYLIESTDVVFLDSIECINKNMLPIKKVNLVNNYLKIITEDKIYNKNLADTLSSEAKRKEYELDLKNGLFYEEFHDNELNEESKRKCQLRLKNGKYYLNIKYFKKYWMISRIAMNGKELILNTTNFSLQDEEKIRFEELRSKYEFEEIKFEGNRTTDWNYYLANSDNAEMEQMLDEDFFGVSIWNKVNTKSRNWIFIPIGVIILTSLMFYFRRIRKRKKNAI